jgi:hypothetical protein
MDDKEKHDPLIEGGIDGATRRAEARAAMINLTDSLPLMIEYVKQNAVLHKVKYDECIKQGFNPTQALELCKVLFPPTGGDA